jgi:hypothetical protein
LLLAGDVACFALFALIGLRSHGEPYTAGNFLRAGAPFAAAWVLFATLAGLYQRQVQGPRLRKVLAVWTPAWLAGLAVRSLAFDRPLKPGFALVALLFIGACLAAWRAAAASGRIRRPSGGAGATGFRPGA